MKKLKSLLFAVIVIGSCGIAMAVDRENLKFYLPLEGSLHPSIAGGNTQLKFIKGTEKDAQFVEGRRGQGLMVTPNFELQYLTRESFSAREGSIAFWMKPVEWSRANKIRFFLVARADQVVVHFYTYFGCPWLYIAGPTRYELVGGGTWPLAFEKTPFADGEWVFFACTYKPGQQAFYINGRQIICRTDGLIEPEFIKQGIVEIPPGDQVVDEIMVFDRVLTEQEIRGIYRGNVLDGK